MRFTSVVAFFCVLQTIVSALPLGSFSDDAIPREYELELDYRSLSEPSLYRRAGPSGSSSRNKKIQAVKQAAKVNKIKSNRPVPYQVDLHRSRVKTENEHWALHFRPQDGHQGTLHTMEAVSDKTKKGVLQPFKADRGEYTKPETTGTSESVDVHIADFKSKSKAMDAINSVHANVKLTQQYPNNNCVDFTCQAVQHMANRNHIPQANAETFQTYLNKEKGDVKTKTDTPENRKNAGVPGS